MYYQNPYTLQRPVYLPNQNQRMNGFGYADQAQYDGTAQMQPNCPVPNLEQQQNQCKQNQDIALCDRWSINRLVAEGILCDLPYDVYNAVVSGSKKLYQHRLYVTAPVVAGQTKFVETNNLKSKGVRNVKSNMIDPNEDFIAVQARLGSKILAVGAADGVIAAAEFFEIEDTNPAVATERLTRTSLDPVLKNAELSIKFTTKNIMIEFPCSGFNNINSNDPTGLVTLDTPFAMPNNIPLEWYLEVNAGAAIPAGLYARMELIGFQVR